MQRIILGIDPGTVVMGYGIIQIDNKDMNLLQFGVLKLSKYSSHYVRLQKIYDRIHQLIIEYQVTEVALEAPFFGKNVQSMLKLGRAQGVAMAAALAEQLPIAEYAPRSVKQAVTGKGAASKEQIAKFLKQMFKFEVEPELLDATDAVAVAVCHFYQNGQSRQKKTSWKAFISDNPDKIL